MKTLYNLFVLLFISGSMLAQTIDTSLVAYFPFNGNADDFSGNGNNGSLMNGVSFDYDRWNNPNKAIRFNKSLSQYVDVQNSPSLQIDSAISFSFWTKRNILDNGQDQVLNKGGDWPGGTCNYGLVFSEWTLCFIYNGGYYIVASPGVPLDHNWHHYAVTAKEGTTEIHFYVDGEEQTTLFGGGDPVINLYSASSANLHIGGVNYYSNNSTDDLKIYNRILDNTEIVALYNDSTTYSPQLISNVYPLQNSNNCLFNESIKIYFTEPMNEATFTYNSVSTFGNLTGSYELSLTYQSSNNSLEIMPTVPFKYGEQITVTLDTTIQSVSGYSLSPFTFQFNVKPEIGSVKFAVADSFQLNFPPTNIVSGDFNNDGKVDVIVSNYDSLKYTVLLNDGGGGFTLGEEMTGEFNPYSISLTDIDCDRDLDMIVSTYEQNKIRILGGTGQGIFWWVLPTLDVTLPIATCPGDFDGDGDNDFVALCNNGYAIVYKNNGAGSFTVYDTISTSVASIRNIVGDIDNDGDLDIIGGTSDYWGTFKILRNNGHGDFSYTGGPYLGPYPDEIAGGDLDGDYNLDFVKYDWYQNGIGIGLNNGVGEFPVEDFFNLGNVGGQTRNPIVEDFDGDADFDFVGVFNGNNVGIVKNNTHPNYELSLSYSIPGINGITAGDFDNNGSVDLAGICSTTNQIKFLKNCVDSLVAYYPFNGNANDYSGNINSGINYNGVFSKDRYGNDNSSIYLNAVDSYVEGINPGNNLPTGNSPRSFSAWIKDYQYNQWGCNIFHYGTQQAAPTNFHFLITDVLGLGNGYGYGVVYGTTNLIDSTWHFVTGVYEGGTERTTKLFIDGKLDASGTISTEPNTTLGTNWHIGRFMEGSSNFNGNIDELKIYNLALTNQQIWDMFKATTTAPNLLFPGNDSTLTNPTMIGLVLDWDSTITATAYRFLLANDSLFNTVIHDTIVNTSSFNFYDWFSVNIDNLYWKVRTINDGGIGPWSETNRFSIILTDIEDETQLPTKFALLQNYPNPFNPSTTITYHLPKTANVELKVYDVLGNEIATLVNEEKPAGVYNVEFGGKSSVLSSGIYFYKLTAEDYVSTEKMILLK